MIQPRFTDEEHQAFIDGKRRARMTKVDAMPADLRACVNEYGLNIVQAFWDLGVQKPRHIRHLVDTVLNDFSPTRGSFAIQGKRTNHDD